MRLLERYNSKISVNMMRRKPEGGGGELITTFPLEILPPFFLFNVNCDRNINNSYILGNFFTLPLSFFKKKFYYIS